jgi:hypothetical protein
MWAEIWTELKRRIFEFVNDLDRDPVVHLCQHQIDHPA